jgi:putative polyketide hydroxylase
MGMIEVPVLIVGGGPVGLSLSIMLSHFGRRSLLVERHPGTSIHPKSRNTHARTMEIFRQYGAEQAVLDAAMPLHTTTCVIWTRTLAGDEIERREIGATKPPARRLSPSPPCFCAQDALEPALRTRAESLKPGELRFDTELTSFTQDADGVTATLIDRKGGGALTMRARYLVGADGVASRVRQTAGIDMIGAENVYRSVNILFAADLTPWTAHRPAALYFVDHPEARGTVLTVNLRDRWGFLFNDVAATGRRGEDFTAADCLKLIRTAVGVPELPVEILGIQPWTASAQVAERYRAGRVFVAGDAAHALPPTGGFGMNTGVQDAHNLAWKLAGVLAGWGAPALLDTYEAERQPVGRFRVEQSMVNAVSMGRREQGAGQAPPGTTARREYLNDLGVIFGDVYESAAVVPDGSPRPGVVNPVTDYEPSARPGGRAPHLWLTTRDGQRVSPHDLCAGGFALLAGPAGGQWCEEALRVAREAALPLSAYTVGAGADLTEADGADDWPSRYGVDASGAVLIRPDGYVAWRARSAWASDGSLARALRW